MSFAQRLVVPATTDSGGDATVYTPVVTGRINAIIYTKTDFDNGVDFTVTTEDSLQNLWVELNVDASATVVPRQPTHSTVGVASLYAAGGEPVEAPIYAANERIKLVVANGGNVKTGSFQVILD